MNVQAKQRRGMGATYKRGDIWWISYWSNGKHYRETTKSTSESDANKLLKKRYGEIANHEHNPRSGKVRFKDLAALIVDDYKLQKRRSLDSVEDCLDHLRRYFGDDCLASAITTPRINAYILERQAQGAANATINRSLAALRRAFNLAVKAKVLLRNDPPFITLLPEPPPREGFVNRGDFQPVLDAIRPHLKDPIKFYYLTAWRDGAVKSLEWRDVDLMVPEIRLRAENSKNGEEQKLPLEGELLETIERAAANRRMACPFVFHHNGKQLKDFRVAWINACTAAGRPDLLIHDLRRSSIRNMRKAGVPETVAMKISGHKTRSVFERYNIVDSSDIREALLKTQQYLAEQPLTAKVTPLIAQKTRLIQPKENRHNNQHNQAVAV